MQPRILDIQSGTRSLGCIGSLFDHNVDFAPSIVQGRSIVKGPSYSPGIIVKSGELLELNCCCIVFINNTSKSMKLNDYSINNHIPRFWLMYLVIQTLTEYFVWVLYKQLRYVFIISITGCFIVSSEKSIADSI